MRLSARPGGALEGEAVAPGDKSISHRTLILGALAHGATEVDGLLESADVLATARAVAAFGAGVERLGPGRWRVTGARWRSPRDPIDCGNSGTACRLLMGAAAGQGVGATFSGDTSLSSRPMRRVTHPLALMGAAIEGGERLPLTLRSGGVGGIDYRLPVPSAQVKSAILLAGLGTDEPVAVTEAERTRDHSERMLRAFGAQVDEADTPEGRRIALGAARRLTGRPVSVPGDPSSAAFPVAAALAVSGSAVTLSGVLMNPLRAGFYQTLAEMGADLSVETAEAGGEPVARLIARHGQLAGVTVPAARAPAMIDEYPVLAALAAFARGTTRMEGVGELRVKESDRIALMVEGLRACGVECEEGPDWLAVHGTGQPPRGGAMVETRGDHRIAMAFLVLGLGARTAVTVSEADMIATSFPGFTALMRGLGADLAEA